MTSAALALDLGVAYSSCKPKLPKRSKPQPPANLSHPYTLRAQPNLALSKRLRDSAAWVLDTLKGPLLNLGDTLGVYHVLKGSPRRGGGYTSRLATAKQGIANSDSASGKSKSKGSLSDSGDTLVRTKRGRGRKYNSRVDLVVPPAEGIRDWDSPYDDPLFPLYALQVASGAIAEDPTLPVEVESIWDLRRIVIENALERPISEKEWYIYRAKMETTDAVAEEIVHQRRVITDTEFLANKFKRVPEHSYTDPNNLERLARLMDNIPQSPNKKARTKHGRSSDRKLIHPPGVDQTIR